MEFHILGLLEVFEDGQAIDLGARLRARYERSWAGRTVDVIWDRPHDHEIKGLSENYLAVSGPAHLHRAGELETVLFQPAGTSSQD